MPNQYYELSPFWKGLGFESVTELVNQWYQDGLINRAYPLHNDILKIFIELGAPGFTLWAVIHYVMFPAYWMKRHDTQTGMLYMAILLYMTATYLTDNTAFYFWCSIGLRLICVLFLVQYRAAADPYELQLQDQQAREGSTVESANIGRCGQRYLAY